MSITGGIQADAAAAMKASDKERVADLRMLLSSLKMGEKEACPEFGKAQEAGVLNKEGKETSPAGGGGLPERRPRAAPMEKMSAPWSRRELVNNDNASRPGNPAS